MKPDPPDVADRRIAQAVREVIHGKEPEPVVVHVIITNSSGRPELMARCYVCLRILRAECAKDPVTGLLRHKGCR